MNVDFIYVNNKTILKDKNDTYYDKVKKSF